MLLGLELNGILHDLALQLKFRLFGCDTLLMFYIGSDVMLIAILISKEVDIVLDIMIPRSNTRIKLKV